ncbi:MAG: ATP-binding protein [Desulfurella sp.]|uniref:ATP-binding protein n=1 Tax=Desulfurella sp. TaxID=1962857 RepID=UPI003D111391
MDEILEEIVKNSKVNKDIIQSYTKHPITGKKYPNRTFYVLLKKYADDFLTSGNEPRMIGLAGLRGTGKTTLMWQLAEHLYDKNIPIYFFNVNALTTSGYSLYDALQVFQKVILKKRFTENIHPLILLFDEVHDDANWAKTLKILYDEARTAFIVCTGSSALLLHQTADLARRMKIEKVYPFRFIEFVTAKSFFEKKTIIFPEKNLANNLKQSLFFSQSVDDAFDILQKLNPSIQNYINKIKEYFNDYKPLVQEYIKYHNIPSFILYKEKSSILESIFSLFTRIVYEDIPKLNRQISVENERIIRLLQQLAISDEINLNSLSQKTGINKNDLEFTLKVINDAELINLLNPYGGAESRIWRNKKAFFMSPSLRLALLSTIYGMNIPSEKQSKFFEDIIAMYLCKTFNNNIFIASQGNSPTPDFVIETMDKPILLEVGRGKKQTTQFSRIDCRYGILVSDNMTEIEKEGNYIKLPLIYFLLL